MARASKDLAKRLRFDRFPKPDFFRRWYWLVGVIFVIVGGVSWYGLHAGTKQRQYLPGPISQVHASFGDRVHSTIEVTTPDCASCHVEHRATGVFLAVANASCVDCHGDLKAKQEPT